MLEFAGKHCQTDSSSRRGVKPVVALLVYEGIGPFQLAGPLMVFGGNNMGEAATELIICSMQAGPVHTSVGLVVSAPRGIEELRRADIIIVPGWPGADEPVPKGLAAALRRAHARGARLLGLSLGVFMLARTGLLDGKRATTHWLRSDAFARRFPRVTLEPGILYAEDGHIWTAAGGASAIDVGLLLIHEVCGRPAAEQAARRILSGPRRSGQSPQFLDGPVTASSVDGRVRRIIEQMKVDPGKHYSVDALAARAHTSTRTFTRRFRQLTGTTYAQWLLSERLAYARHLLTETSYSVEQISTLVGYRYTLSLRKHFRQAYGMSPSEFRKRNHLQPPKGGNAA